MDEFTSIKTEERIGNTILQEDLQKTDLDSKRVLAVQQLKLLGEKEAYRVKLRENMFAVLQKDKPMDTSQISNDTMTIKRNDLETDCTKITIGEVQEIPIPTHTLKRVRRTMAEKQETARIERIFTQEKMKVLRQAETEAVENGMEWEVNNREALKECDLALARKLDETETSSLEDKTKCEQSSNPILLPRFKGWHPGLDNHKRKHGLETDNTSFVKIAVEVQERPIPTQQQLTNKDSEGKGHQFYLEIAEKRQNAVKIALNAVTKSSLKDLLRTSISQHFKNQVPKDEEDIPINKSGEPQNLHYSRLPNSEEDPKRFTPKSTPKCKPQSVRTPEDFCRLFLIDEMKENPFSLETPDTSSLCNLVASFWWIKFKGIPAFSKELVISVKQIRKLRNDLAHDNPEIWTREKFLQSATIIDKLATILNDTNLRKAVTIMRQSEPTNCEFCGTEMKVRCKTKLVCVCCNSHSHKLRSSNISSNAMINDKNMKRNTERAKMGIREEMARKKREGKVNDPFTRRKTAPVLATSVLKKEGITEIITSEFLAEYAKKQKVHKDKIPDMIPIAIEHKNDHEQTTTKDGYISRYEAEPMIINSDPEVKWTSSEKNKDIQNLYEFTTLTSHPEKPLELLGGDVMIHTKTSQDIIARFCPPDEYDDFTKCLKKEEELCPATPIIQIAGFDKSCGDICIRHNVYEWKQYQKCVVRVYSNLQDVFRFEAIEAEMCEDYIHVCGQTSTEEKGVRQEPKSTKPDKRNSRSGSKSSDEGYGRHDGSPQQAIQSLVFVAKSQEICDVKLYFSREIRENRCPSPHGVSVFAVLEKKAKIAEFKEKILPECGMEQAAQRIRVAIFPHQEYTPFLGESTKENPKIVWEEESTFCSFSYSSLNQKRGIVLLQKMPPPLMLHCDRKTYVMMQNKTPWNAGQLIDIIDIVDIIESSEKEKQGDKKRKLYTGNEQHNFHWKKKNT